MKIHGEATTGSTAFVHHNNVDFGRHPQILIRHLKTQDNFINNKIKGRALTLTRYLNHRSHLHSFCKKYFFFLITFFAFVISYRCSVFH